MEHMNVHVAQLILDAFHQFVITKPPRHPMDPNKSNKALGFPALITCLCQFYGAPVTPAKHFRPPINRSFIDKYCMPRQVQQLEQFQQPQPATDSPPPPQHSPSLESISTHLQRMELQMHTYMRHLADQQETNHWGQMQLNDNFYYYTLHQHC